MMRSIGIVLVISSALTFSAWAGGQTEGSSQSATQPAGGKTLINQLDPTYQYPTGPVKVVLWDFWEGERPLRTQYERKVAGQYETIHPNVSIDIVGIPVTDYQTKYKVALNSGTGPDILLDGVTDMGNFGWNKQTDAPKFGHAVPDWLLTYMKKVLRPAALRGGAIESPDTGKLIYLGVCQQADGGLYLYYNRDFFDQAGISAPPSTTSELIDDAKKLTQRSSDGKITREGFAVRFRGGWNVGFKAYPIFWAFVDGTKPFLFSNDYRNTPIDDSAHIEAISKYASLISDLKVASPLLPDADEAMLTGLAAMSFRESFFWQQLTQKAPQYKFGVAPVPNGAPPWGTNVVGTNFGPEESLMAVSNDESKVNIDFDIMAQIQLVPENDLEMAKRQGITPLLAANMDSDYARNLPVAQAEAVYEKRPTMVIGVSPYGNTAQVQSIFGKAMETILNQNADPAATIKTAAQDIRKVISDSMAASN